MQYPYVHANLGACHLVFRSINDIPIRLATQSVEDGRRRIEVLLNQADLWERVGFFGNASIWRKEARTIYLDVYRMTVELGMSEEDEDLEEEIQSCISENRATAEVVD